MSPSHEDDPQAEAPLTIVSFAHDIRQSLFAIHMATRLLERSRGSEAQFAELCKSIEIERQRASDLLDRFLVQSEARDRPEGAPPSEQDRTKAG